MQTIFPAHTMPRVFVDNCITYSFRSSTLKLWTKAYQKPKYRGIILSLRKQTQTALLKVYFRIIVPFLESKIETSVFFESTSTMTRLIKVSLGLRDYKREWRVTLKRWTKDNRFHFSFKYLKIVKLKWKRETKTCFDKWKSDYFLKSMETTLLSDYKSKERLNRKIQILLRNKFVPAFRC